MVCRSSPWLFLAPLWLSILTSFRNFSLLTSPAVLHDCCNYWPPEPARYSDKPTELEYLSANASSATLLPSHRHLWGYFPWWSDNLSGWSWNSLNSCSSTSSVMYTAAILRLKQTRMPASNEHAVDTFAWSRTQRKAFRFEQIFDF